MHPSVSPILKQSELWCWHISMWKTFLDNTRLLAGQHRYCQLKQMMPHFLPAAFLHNVCFIDAAYCQTSSACMWKQLYKTDMKWSPIRYLHRHVWKSWWTTRVCGSAGTAASLICSVHIDTYCDLIIWEKSSTYPMKIIDSDHRQQSDDLLFFPEGTTKEKSTALDRQHSHGVQTHGSHVSESQSQVRLSRTRIVLPYKGR